MGTALHVDWRGRAGTHAVHSALQFLLSRCLTVGGGWLELRYRVFFPFAERVFPLLPRCRGSKDDRLQQGLSPDRGLQQPEGKHFINISTGRRRSVWWAFWEWVKCEGRDASRVIICQHIWVLYVALVGLNKNDILRQVEKHIYIYFSLDTFHISVWDNNLAKLTNSFLIWDMSFAPFCHCEAATQWQLFGPIGSDMKLSVLKVMRKFVIMYVCARACVCATLVMQYLEV